MSEPDTYPDRRAQRRGDIIRAAQTCFLRQGYHNTTMDDIVAESGLSKGSLYWYFDSKDALFAAVLESFLETFGQESLAVLAQHESAADKLRAGAALLATFTTEAEGLFGLFLEFWAQSPHRLESSQLWAHMLVEYREIVAGVIEQGIRSGEFKQVDARQLVWALMATYDGLAAYAMLMPDLDLGQISQAFIETVLTGLCAEEGSSGLSSTPA
jgi:TetR/AcrR family transcriptional repressor of uid operon